MLQKIGLGGGCHWCTEAVFQSLHGVSAVQQGWISSDSPYNELSEGVAVSFNDEIISLHTLIAVHLHTHSCTSIHSMRSKYRSAVYTFSAGQISEAAAAINILQRDFDLPIITMILPFRHFKLNNQSFLNYYYKNPKKPFCQTYINPKLKLLLQQFAALVNKGQLKLTDAQNNSY